MPLPRRFPVCTLPFGRAASSRARKRFCSAEDIWQEVRCFMCGVGSALSDCIWVWIFLATQDCRQIKAWGHGALGEEASRVACIRLRSDYVPPQETPFIWKHTETRRIVTSLSPRVSSLRSVGLARPVAGERQWRRKSPGVTAVAAKSLDRRCPQRTPTVRESWLSILPARRSARQSTGESVRRRRSARVVDRAVSTDEAEQDAHGFSPAEEDECHCTAAASRSLLSLAADGRARQRKVSTV